jgi:hypothetical protein
MPVRVMLMRTVDRLNIRCGRETVTFAANGRRPGKLRRGILSRRGRVVAGLVQPLAGD